MFPDVFKPDLFTTTAMTAAINQVPFVPGLIGGLGIFDEEGVATTSVAIERVKGQLALVQSSKRGSVGSTQSDDKRTGYQVAIPHLQKNDALMADSVQGVREFGTVDQLRTVEAQRDRKLARMALDLDLTLEYHRMGAIQGIVLDADGVTTLVNWFTVFGIAAPTEVDFDLDAASPAEGAVLVKCHQITRGIDTALGGLNKVGTQALCGDTFFDQLVSHKELRETWKYQQGERNREGQAYRTIRYGDIDFTNYRGTGAVTIGATKCRFFPTGVPDLFKTFFAPADYLDTVNTIGLPRYSSAEPMKHNKGLELEAQSNPLNVCTIPEVLFSARNT